MNDAQLLRRDLKPALVFLSGELIAVPIPLDIDPDASGIGVQGGPNAGAHARERTAQI